MKSPDQTPVLVGAHVGRSGSSSTVAITGLLLDPLVVLRLEPAVAYANYEFRRELP